MKTIGGGLEFSDYIAFQLKIQGFTQDKIADIFGTHQGNISKKLKNGSLNVHELKEIAQKTKCKDILMYAFYKQLEPLVSQLIS